MMAHPFVSRIASTQLARPYGRIRKVAQGYFEASGPASTVGDICVIEDDGEASSVLAEVASADEQGLILIPLERD